MNIIISSLDEIKTTGVSKDLDSAKLFILNSLDIDSLLASPIQLIGTE
jgi:hypothetical protein